MAPTTGIANGVKSCDQVASIYNNYHIHAFISRGDCLVRYTR